MLELKKSIKEQMWELIQGTPKTPFTMHDLLKDAEEIKLKMDGNSISATLYVFWKEGCIRRLPEHGQPYPYVITGKKPFFQKKGHEKPEKTHEETDAETLAQAFVAKFIEMSRQELELNTQVHNLQTRCNQLTLQNSALEKKLENGSTTYRSGDLGL